LQIQAIAACGRAPALAGMARTLYLAMIEAIMNDLSSSKFMAIYLEINDLPSTIGTYMMSFLSRRALSFIPASSVLQRQAPAAAIQ